MRNYKEVYEFILKEDHWGITIGDILIFMSLEEVKKLNICNYDNFIKEIETGKRKMWEKKEYNPKEVLNKIKDYIEFAWGKANNCRGLSTWRSIQHFRNWFYMLGDKDIDKLVKDLKDYSYYSKPQLAIICELMNINWEKYDNGYWGNNEDNLEELSLQKRKGIINTYKIKIPFNEIKKKIEQMLKSEIVRKEERNEVFK